MSELFAAECCCVTAPGCWYRASWCSCSTSNPLPIYVPCPVVTALMFFHYAGACYWVAPSSTQVSQLHAGEIEVIPQPPFYSSCGHCCQTQAPFCTTWSGGTSSLVIAGSGFPPCYRRVCNGVIQTTWPLPTSLMVIATYFGNYPNNGYGGITPAGNFQHCQNPSGNWVEYDIDAAGGMQGCVNSGSGAEWQASLGVFGMYSAMYRRPRLVDEVSPGLGAYTLRNFSLANQFELPVQHCGIPFPNPPLTLADFPPTISVS